MSETICVFTGLRFVDPGTDADVSVGKDFTLVEPDSVILSATQSFGAMNQYESSEVKDYRYLMYKRPFSYADDPVELRDRCSERLNRAVMAFQIIKPLQTSGFTFLGTESSSGDLHLETAERRAPMDVGPWARMRHFDATMLAQVPDTLAKIDKVMGGTKAEPKNAITLLQLSLEHTRFHVLLAGLLAVMGMEAIFDSGDRKDFKRKLCRRIGAKTLAFPDWNSPMFQPPKDTAASVAVPLYALRSKIAHGSDFRSAMPIDLLRKVELVPEMEKRPHAVHLSEAAPYLLSRVLQKAL